MAKTANEEMVSQINNELIASYQDDSLLGLFASEDIGDIGIENWYHRNIDDIPDAALTSAGFNPQEAKINTNIFKNEVYTAAEKMVINEQQLAQFQKLGLDVEGIGMMGKKVGQLASNYLFRGQDFEGNAPSTQYNFIKDPGTGNGTLARPLISTAATGGAWGTYANKVADINGLLGRHVAHDYSLESSTCYYPRSSYAAMNSKGNATNDVSAITMLQDAGVECVMIPNKYMYTLAGALPTNALFDLLLVDHSQIKIGYTRTERSQVIGPYGTVRSTTAEVEVWFCPYIVPRPWAEDSKIYKGISELTAIAPA